MNDKNYLITMALTGMVLAVSLMYLAETTDAFASHNSVNNQTVHESSPAKYYEFEKIPEQTVDCTLCHKHPENLTEHAEGGKYCAACHGTELHDLHSKDTTSAITCKTCHGSSTDVEIPQRLQGHTAVCDTCHGYPNPLSPSYGNLITIHISRGHTCDICHVQDLQSLHEVKHDVIDNS